MPSIEDGTGTGKRAKVDEENRLRVEAVSERLIHHINHDEGAAYSMVFDQAAANGAADELLLYIKNTDDEDMIIDEINITISAANIVYCKLGDSGTVGGTPTAIVPANLNAGSGKSATGTFYKDDAMSGLSGGAIAIWRYLTAAAETKNICPSSGLIVPKNQVFTLYVETQQAQTIQGEILFGYHGA